MPSAMVCQAGQGLLHNQSSSQRQARDHQQQRRSDLASPPPTTTPQTSPSPPPFARHWQVRPKRGRSRRGRRRGVVYWVDLDPSSLLSHHHRRLRRSFLLPLPVPTSMNHFRAPPPPPPPFPPQQQQAVPKVTPRRRRNRRPGQVPVIERSAETIRAEIKRLQSREQALLDCKRQLEQGLQYYKSESARLRQVAQSMPEIRDEIPPLDPPDFSQLAVPPRNWDALLASSPHLPQDNEQRPPETSSPSVESVAVEPQPTITSQMPFDEARRGQAEPNLASNMPIHASRNMPIHASRNMPLHPSRNRTVSSLPDPRCGISYLTHGLQSNLTSTSPLDGARDRRVSSQTDPTFATQVLPHRVQSDGLASTMALNGRQTTITPPPDPRSGESYITRGLQPIVPSSIPPGRFLETTITPPPDPRTGESYITPITRSILPLPPPPRSGQSYITPIIPSTLPPPPDPRSAESYITSRLQPNLTPTMPPDEAWYRRMPPPNSRLGRHSLTQEPLREFRTSYERDMVQRVNRRGQYPSLHSLPQDAQVFPSASSQQAAPYDDPDGPQSEPGSPSLEPRWHESSPPPRLCDYGSYRPDPPSVTPPGAPPVVERNSSRPEPQSVTRAQSPRFFEHQLRDNTSGEPRRSPPKRHMPHDDDDDRDRQRPRQQYSTVESQVRQHIPSYQLAYENNPDRQRPPLRHSTVEPLVPDHIPSYQVAHYLRHTQPLSMVPIPGPRFPPQPSHQMAQDGYRSRQSSSTLYPSVEPQDEGRNSQPPPPPYYELGPPPRYMTDAPQDSRTSRYHPQLGSQMPPESSLRRRDPPSLRSTLSSPAQTPQLHPTLDPEDPFSLQVRQNNQNKFKRRSRPYELHSRTPLTPDSPSDSDQEPRSPSNQASRPPPVSQPRPPLTPQSQPPPTPIFPQTASPYVPTTEGQPTPVCPVPGARGRLPRTTPPPPPPPPVPNLQHTPPVPVLRPTPLGPQPQPTPLPSYQSAPQFPHEPTSQSQPNPTVPRDPAFEPIPLLTSRGRLQTQVLPVLHVPQGPQLPQPGLESQPCTPFQYAFCSQPSPCLDTKQHETFTIPQSAYWLSETASSSSGSSTPAETSSSISMEVGPPVTTNMTESQAPTVTTNMTHIQAPAVMAEMTRALVETAPDGNPMQIDNADPRFPSDLTRDVGHRGVRGIPIAPHVPSRGPGLAMQSAPLPPRRQHYQSPYPAVTPRPPPTLPAPILPRPVPMAGPVPMPQPAFPRPALPHEQMAHRMTPPPPLEEMTNIPQSMRVRPVRATPEPGEEPAQPTPPVARPQQGPPRRDESSIMRDIWRRTVLE